MKKHSFSIFFLCFFLAAFLAFHSCRKKQETKEVPLTALISGTFYLDMYEEGVIEAVNSTNLSAPTISWRYGNLKITQIVKDGTEVKQGDTVIVFDPSEVQKGVVDAESRVQMNLADLEKLKAQQQSELEELRASYEITRISQQISRIRFESAGYEADIKKKEIKLNLDKANIALDRAKEEIDNKIKIQKEEVKQKKLSIRRSIGARKKDIMDQFVSEAVAISITGGMIGVVLGVALSLTVSFFTDVQTYIQPYSIFLAFGFSVLVGISFGYLPAKNAANLKPVDSLRYE